VEVNVCRDLTCHLRGAGRLTARLTAEFSKDQRVRVQEVSCLGRCDRARAVCINRTEEGGGEVHDAFYLGRRTEALVGVVKQAVAGGPLPAPDTDVGYGPAKPAWDINIYPGKPDYQTARDRWEQLDLLTRFDPPAVARKSLDIIPKVKASGLRGMGGAGAPTGKKWQDVADAAGDVKYIVCNGDESEPGTFKDREILLRYPHLVVEGVILAGIACGATRGYIYIRHEYPEQVASVRKAIASAEKLGACGPRFPVGVYVSPGGYICGEQSALIEAMQGNRAQPRNRPPELATNGLFDKPTLVNNVETFAWVPGIVRNTDLYVGKPANWYAELGPQKKGKRLYSISGDLNRPGVYEIPIGAPLRDLINAAGGVIGGEDALLAVATSGPSGGFVPRHLPLGGGRGSGKLIDLLDVELDIDAFRKLGLALGAGLVAYAQGTDMLSAAVNATQFYKNESCGKCVPCRIGCGKLVEIGTGLIGRAKAADAYAKADAVVRDLDKALEQTSICGLGQVAAKPLASVLRYFLAAPPAARQSARL
jgi:NADH:ubiquinone oxidoreductase subunit F (NADH-binding)